MSFPITQAASAEAALHQAAQALRGLLTIAHDKPTLFLSSGGSSLALLDDISEDLLHSALTISVSDDRYSYDPQINNFAQLMAKPLYHRAVSKGCAFIDTRPRPNETLEAVGMRFDASLKVWVRAHPDGSVLMTEGIGPDRHTCGILPHPEDPQRFRQLFDQDDCWAVGYKGKGKNEYLERITITLPFLRQQVTHSVVYACGSAKLPALQALVDPEGDLATTPVRILCTMANAHLFTDQAIVFP